MKISRASKLFAAIAALSFNGSAWADCKLPPAPAKIPDGNSAGEREMVAAMQTLKRYNFDVTNFVKCLEFEAAQNRLSRVEQARQHNAAIEGLEKIAEKFNDQVRVYKAKGG